MSALARLPVAAEVFLDTRGEARSLRVRWHEAEGLVLLSLWRGGECTATFRLDAEDVPELIAQLRDGPEPTTRY